MTSPRKGPRSALTRGRAVTLGHLCPCSPRAVTLRTQSRGSHLALADAGPRSLPGEQQVAPEAPATPPGQLPLSTASELSPREGCPQPRFICGLIRVKRSFYSKPIYTHIVAKANSSRKRTIFGLSDSEKFQQNQCRNSSLHKDKFPRHTHPPGEGQRTAKEERWTSCDLATGLAVSPLGCARDALPGAQKPGHTPEGSRSACEEAQPLRRALPWGVRTAGACGS